MVKQGRITVEVIKDNSAWNGVLVKLTEGGVVRTSKRTHSAGPGDPGGMVIFDNIELKNDTEPIKTFYVTVDIEETTSYYNPVFKITDVSQVYTVEVDTESETVNVPDTTTSLPDETGTGEEGEYSYQEEDITVQPDDILEDKDISMNDRVINAWRDWGLMEVSDRNSYARLVNQYLEGEKSFIDVYAHRQLDSVLAETTEQYGGSGSTVWLEEEQVYARDIVRNNISGGTKTVEIKNNYAESFLVTVRYRNRVIELEENKSFMEPSSWGFKSQTPDQVREWIYVTSPNQTRYADVGESVTKGDVTLITFCISAYAVTKDIPSGLQSVLRTDKKGRNLLNYFRDNDSKYSAWKSGKFELWSPIQERENVMYDFEGDMGITAEGLKFYTKTHNVLPRSQIPKDQREKVQRSQTISGIIMLFTVLAFFVFLYLVWRYDFFKKLFKKEG